MDLGHLDETALPPRSAQGEGGFDLTPLLAVTVPVMLGLTPCTCTPRIWHSPTQKLRGIKMSLIFFQKLFCVCLFRYALRICSFVALSEWMVNSPWKVCFRLVFLGWLGEFVCVVCVCVRSRCPEGT